MHHGRAKTTIVNHPWYGTFFSRGKSGKQRNTFEQIFERRRCSGHNRRSWHCGCRPNAQVDLAPYVGCRMSACRFFAQTATFCVVSVTCRRHVSVMSQTQENVVSARVSKRHDI